MHGFHASNAQCTYGWKLHVVSVALAVLVGFIATALAWFG